MWASICSLALSWKILGWDLPVVDTFYIKAEKNQREIIGINSTLNTQIHVSSDLKV